MKKVNKKGSVDLTRLPIYTSGSYEGKIKWKESIGCYVPFVYDDLCGELKIEEYIYPENNKDKAKIRLSYNNKIIDDIITITHFKNAYIGSLLRLRHSDFKIEIGTQFKDNKRDLVITDREYRINKSNNQNVKWYKYTCNVCTWTEGWIVESPLRTKKVGCSCCSGRTAVLGINTIWDTERWMMDLGVSEEDAKSYTRASNEKIKVTCPDCGREKHTTIRRIHREKSIGCDCGDGFSYPSKLMVSILTQLNIKFETEYSPNYIKPKRSDFYLPDYNLVIETDGKLGHEGGFVHGYSKKSLEEYIEVDKWKDKQHKLNGIETIRINCFESDMEYIKLNILNSELVDYFDLSNIDWNEADLFAWKTNLKWEVCNYWKNKKDWETATDIESIFKLSGFTTVEYLKKGTKLKWCEYDAKEESKKGSIKAGKLSGKKVEIFRDGVSLGVLESTMELERQSEKLFGIKLDHRNISAVCNGKKDNYKGFTFEYCMNSQT